MENEGEPAITLVKDFGVTASHCGYCGSEEGSVAHGMSVDSMSVEAYQELLDRGWRRSGRWLYAPVHDSSCCQLLTIRLDVNTFQPNKEQRRAERRWEAYLAGAAVEGGAAAAAAQRQQPQRQQPEEPQGASPKRPLEEDAPTLLPSSPPARQGAGKRQRGASGAEGLAAAASNPTGFVGGLAESPLGARGRIPSIATQLTDVHLTQQALAQQALEQQQQAQPAGGSAPTMAADDSSSGVSEASLGACLQAALSRCVEAGLLPTLAYPPVKVQRATARQQKILPPGVVFTSPFPLAAAAAINRAAKGEGAAAPTTTSSSSGGGSTPEAVAASLLAACQLPDGLSALPLKGHVNISRAVTVAALAKPAADSGAAGQQPPVHTGTARRAGSSIPEAVPAAAVAGAGGGGHSSPLAAAWQAAQAAAAAAGVGQQVPRGVPRHYEFRMLRSSDPSLLSVEFHLWRNYQVVHHGDEPATTTPSAFHRFLCESPLTHAGPERYPPGRCPPQGYGSFHQQYWLDGRLIAVGVVDVLPRCLSSKYLFWEPDLGPLSLGKVTSLKEIGWVRDAGVPSLRYYYLGFYIHTCHRMQYKGDFGPSDLLCPVSKCWVPLERVRAALAAPGMVALSEVAGALEGLGADHLVQGGAPMRPPREPDAGELDSVRLVCEPTPCGGEREVSVVTFGQLRRAGALPEDAEEQLALELRRWAKASGPAWRRMLYMLFYG